MAKWHFLGDDQVVVCGSAGRLSLRCNAPALSEQAARQRFGAKGAGQAMQALRSLVPGMFMGLVNKPKAPDGAFLKWA